MGPMDTTSGQPAGGPGPVRVASPDGTEIAYWTSGYGPPLVMVHGVTADHSRWQPLLPYLEPHATVCAIDRRGRGASGDGPDYRLAREWEDVAAVIDAVATATGTPVDVYGHSYGGLCAFGAALLTGNVRRLVLYEGWPAADPSMHAFPREVEERLDTLLAAGEHDAAVETLFRFFGGTDEEVRGLRAQPAWQARVAAAHTITREVRAIDQAQFDPSHAARITVPTLLLTGADSPDPATADLSAVAGALPDARVVVMEGQGHLADVLAPETFAGHVVAFLRGDGPA
jgi:pimeloyl-ACP methyl ester carboxylesterase